MISASVGQGGQNRRQDVTYIQQLLNKVITSLAPLRSLSVDGAVGPKTIEAIKEYQRRIVGINPADGRVDPNGKTLAALEKSSTMSIGLQRNLETARRALAYVKQKVHIGASNKLSDIMSSKGKSLICVAESRIHQQLIDAGFSKPDWATGKLYIEILAMGTENAGCGNCGEQTAVAFVYIWKQLNVTPIDFMYWTNGLPILQTHGFVIVGRSPGLASNPKSWGTDAVVCDPWNGSAYPASDIGNHMPGKSVDSMLRVD